MGRHPVATDPGTEAFHAARRRFLAGQRLELADVADAAGISRVTVFRRLGNRSQLLADVVWSLTEPTLEACYRDAPGHGGPRLATTFAEWTRLTLDHPGFAAFLNREHETALRVLTRRDHDFQPRLLALVRDLLRREQDAGHPAAGGDVDLDDLAFLVVKTVEAFVYVEPIVGETPDPARAARALRFLLR